MIGSKPSPGSDDARLFLSTLGDAALYRVDATLSRERVIEIGKPLALLTYLSSTPGREAHRDRLCELLWSQMDPDSALRALRATLHLLRQKTQLGDRLFERRGDRVALIGDISSDRDALLAASAVGNVEEVVRHYAGDFLTGFATPGGVEFDLWADSERRALRRIFLHSADESIRARIAIGRTRDALALARRVRDIDPTNQAAWRRVLECCVASTDMVAVRIELDAIERLLGADEIEAEAATHAAIQDARALGKNGSRETGISVPQKEKGFVAELVGREREFAVLTQAWKETMQGTARRFHLVAPAGLGKTRLLLELRSRLRSVGARVVYVRANQAMRDMAYGFASEIAASVARLRGAGGVSPESAASLVAMSPTLSATFSVQRDPATGDEALRRRALALRELLAAVAEESPLVLLLDDLHWSDAVSFLAIETAAGSLDRAHVMVVSSSRPSADAPREPHAAERIPIPPLSQADVAALVASIADLPPQAATFTRALYDAAGGSPLFVLEALQLLTDRGLLTLESGAWAVTNADQAAALLAEGSGVRRRVEALEDVDQRFLQFLALNETSLRLDQIAEAGCWPVNDLGRRVAVLEQRGFVTRAGDHTTIAHDAHCAAVLEVASAASLREVASVLGRVLIRDAAGDPRRVCFAASLLARSDRDDDRSLLVRIAGQFVRSMRITGDRRPDRDIVRELVGPAARDELQRFLVRSLPLPVRARLVTRERVVGAIATLGILLLASIGAWSAFTRPIRPPDAVLVARRLSADRKNFEMFQIQIDASRWAGVSIIDVKLNGHPSRHRALPPNGGDDLRPDGRGWTGGVSLADSGVIDIFDYDVNGGARRLTFAKLDDLEPSWAPDNSQFVFSTARWSDHGRYDLAVYDTLTRATRHLTKGDDTDERPKWSPDGSRIAFSRTDFSSGIRGLCLIDTDGANLRCVPGGATSGTMVIGWADAHRVYLRQDAEGAVRLIRFDVDADSADFIDDHDGNTIISPDGRFAVCQCPRRGYPAGTWIAYPIERPDEFAVLRGSGEDQRSLDFEWAPKTPRAPWVSRIELSTGLGPPVVGIPHQLRALGFDSAGRLIPIGTVRWRSEDTSVASIDATGRLMPRRAGRVSIVASAGGWREVHTTLTIVEPAARLLFDEDWSGALAPRWRAFGVPQPVLVRSTALGKAFLNNGDGSFFSGAYTTSAFETRGGLWVEADLSTPIAASDSQDLLISLFNNAPDSAAWAAWDHVTGDGPPIAGSVRSVSVRYPRGAGGTHWGEQIGAFCGGESDIDVPPGARAGRPFHFVMQIFPDGRCGLAFDGRAALVSAVQFLEPTVRVELAGNSVGTRLLVGHLRVLSGVAPNIDWTQPQSAADATAR